MTEDEVRVALAADAAGVGIVVWAVPGAQRTELTGLHGNALRVRVAAVPERGKANRAIGAFLARRLGVRGVELVSGAGGRRKRFIAPGVTVCEAARRLADEG